MTNQQIIEAIAEKLVLPPADIDMEASLKDNLGLNPVEIADLVDFLGQKFQIIFEHSETEHLQTISDLVELVEDKLLD